MNEHDELMAADEARADAVIAEMDAARTKLDEAEQVWRKAQAAFQATFRPLHEEFEHLLCNSDEWPSRRAEVATTGPAPARGREGQN